MVLAFLPRHPLRYVTSNPGNFIPAAVRTEHHVDPWDTGDSTSPPMPRSATLTCVMRGSWGALSWSTGARWPCFSPVPRRTRVADTFRVSICDSQQGNRHCSHVNGAVVVIPYFCLGPGGWHSKADSIRASLSRQLQGAGSSDCSHE